MKLRLTIFFMIFSLPCFSFSAEQARPETDTIDRADFRMAMRPHVGEMKNCYAELLKTDSGAAGKVVLNMEINDNGRVVSTKTNPGQSKWMSNAGQGKEGASLAKIGNCLDKKMKAIKFPPAPKGTKAFVTYPFVFGSK